MTPEGRLRGLDDLRAQIARLEEDDRHAAGSIDRVILFGGTTAILVSVSFLRDIAPQPAAGTLAILGWSWLAFLIGSLLAFASLFTARVAARRYRKVLEGKLQAQQVAIKPEELKSVRCPNAVTRWLTRAGAGLFLLGVCLLLLFAWLNLPEEKTVDLDTGIPASAVTTQPEVSP